MYRVTFIRVERNIFELYLLVYFKIWLQFCCDCLISIHFLMENGLFVFIGSPAKVLYLAVIRGYPAIQLTVRIEI